MKLEKVKKLVANLHGRTEYVSHVRNLKKELNHELILKLVHTVIQLNQGTWLNSYINMNTKLRQNAKNNFEKLFSS